MAENTDILAELGKKQDSSESLAEAVIKDPKKLSTVIGGVASENPRIKFRSAKILRMISEKEPELIYPELDFFTRLLDSENNILKWNAIDTIANLTVVDRKNKFDRIFGKFYGLLREGSLVTAAHVVENSGKIARAKPKLRARITKELLKAERIKLPTEECRNIILGKVILAVDEYFDQIQDKVEIISLVRKQLKNSRKSTRIRAEKFLRKNS